MCICIHERARACTHIYKNIHVQVYAHVHVCGGGLIQPLLITIATVPCMHDVADNTALRAIAFYKALLHAIDGRTELYIARPYGALSRRADSAVDWAPTHHATLVTRPSRCPSWHVPCIIGGSPLVPMVNITPHPLSSAHGSI